MLLWSILQTYLFVHNKIKEYFIFYVYLFIYYLVEDLVSDQRERLTNQLYRGTLECLVCCERIRQSESVWSCSNCQNILHLKCTIKWASSSRDGNS